jgi:hypothetical protein
MSLHEPKGSGRALRVVLGIVGKAYAFLREKQEHYMAVYASFVLEHPNVGRPEKTRGRVIE